MVVVYNRAIAGCDCNSSIPMLNTTKPHGEDHRQVWRPHAFLAPEVPGFLGLPNEGISMKVFLTCLQRPARCCNWIRRISRVWEAQLQLLVLGPVLHGLEFRDQGLGIV